MRLQSSDSLSFCLNILVKAPLYDTVSEACKHSAADFLLTGQLDKAAEALAVTKLQRHWQ